MLDDIDPATIPDAVQGVYWWDLSANVWKFWGTKGAFDPSLLELVPGQPYSVSVTGACEWYITYQ